jgi:transposase
MFPGASVGAIASTHGMHASVLHRWLHNHRLHDLQSQSTMPSAVNPKRADFITLTLSALQAAPAACAAQSIELRCQRTDTMISVIWPLSGAAECASLILKVLR